MTTRPGQEESGVAFESFRGQQERRSRRQRQASLALSIVFHGALVAAGVAHSYWHVDELAPPKLRVTFMSIPPSPPPPMPRLVDGRGEAREVAPPASPPAGGHAAPKKVAIEAKVLEPVSPLPVEDEYDDEDAKPSATVFKHSIGEADSSEDHGVDGGTKRATHGGTAGGTSVAASAVLGPQSVSPRFGTLQKESGDMPPFPSSLMHDKLVYVVDTRICVSTTGAVYRLTIRKRSGTILDANVVDTVKKWRYRPLTVNKVPVPFCYPVRFEFRSES
jgi:TonB family protein